MSFLLILSIFTQYLETQIVVGKLPLEVCYNSINHKVYVRKARASSIIIIDGATNEIIDSITGVLGAHALVYNFLNNKLYCAYGYRKDSVLIIDGATNQVIKRILNTPCGGKSIFNPINNKIYFANYRSNSVSVIDGERDSLIKIIEEGIGEGPTHFSLAEERNKIYCINTWSGDVSVILSDLDSVIKIIPVAPRPGAICYNSQNKKIYVTHIYDPVVEVICAERDTLITTVYIGSPNPGGICYDSTYNKIYVSTAANYVVVIDGETDRIVDIIYFYCWPWMVFYNPISKKIYISYENPYNIMFVGIIEARTRQKIDSISLYRTGAYYPFCLNPRENRVYIPHAWIDAQGNPMDSVVSVIRDVISVKENFSDSFEIKYSSNFINPKFIVLPSGVESIEIYDNLGKLIKKSKSKNKEFKIPLKELKSGIYFIKIITFKKEYIKKLIIFGE